MQIAPTYRPIMMQYFRMVKPRAANLLLNGFDSSSMSPRSLNFTFSPVKIGTQRATRVSARTAYVEAYIHICTEIGGLPLPWVNHVTRIRQERNMMANIGA